MTTLELHGKQLIGSEASSAVRRPCACRSGPPAAPRCSETLSPAGFRERMRHDAGWSEASDYTRHTRA